MVYFICLRTIRLTLRFSITEARLSAGADRPLRTTVNYIYERIKACQEVEPDAEWGPDVGRGAERGGGLIGGGDVVVDDES